MFNRSLWRSVVLLALSFFLSLSARADGYWTASELGSPKGRGFNLQTAKLSAKDVADMARLGARIGRFHLVDTKCGFCYGYEADGGDLRRLDRFIEYARASKVGVIIVLDPIPRGRKADFWSDEKAQSSLIEIWRGLARKYAKETAVAGYDLLNEPDPEAGPSGNGNKIWIPLANKFIEAIRSEDKNHAIVFEPAPLGAAYGLDTMGPLRDSNIAYSFHFYEPHRLTHQGLLGFPMGPSYPGVVGFRGYWDKDRLSEYMEPARKFQKKYRVPIFVGEFSFIRWAPGNSRYLYLRDVIDLFEKEGWGWLYHSFREWDGWDLELPSGSKNARSRIETTPELALIQKHLK